jgi:GTP-binding protein Era
MLIENQHPHNKSIMISVLGKPNVGKSTMINHFLGFDLGIVSNKPQTTRNHYHCAFTIDRTEVVFVDTPGVHKSSKELNIRMNGQAQFGSEGTDLNFFLVDLSSRDIMADVKEFKSEYEYDLGKTWVIFTKLDLVKKTQDEVAEIFEMIKAEIPSVEKFFTISTKEGTNIHDLTGAICDEATEGPHMYPYGDVSNKNERFFASEYIREQAFRLLKDELPYELAVVIEDFADLKEIEGKKLDAKISASILVNRPSQRAIVVGSKGSVIKEIGSKSRKKIEAMVGGPVHLNLHVKVAPKWFKNNYVLDEIGLPRTKKSHRVWRAR